MYCIRIFCFPVTILNLLTVLVPFMATSMVMLFLFTSQPTLRCSSTAKKHGMFEQRPDDHINKKCGCNTCGCTITCEKTSLTTDEFIKKATQVHGDRFDYSLVDYKTSQKKVKIICKLHGVFEQKPNNHLNGSICFKCGLKNRSDKRRDTLDLFLNKAKSIHCDKYDYSEVNYLGSQINIKITCPEHGYFLQSPNHHLRGVGCPGCAKSGFVS